MKQTLLTYIVLFSLSLIHLTTLAQVSVVKGKVTDENTADPLPYVNIGVKGQATGTFSESNGAFRLELTAGEYDLFISSVGYEKMEKHIHVDGRKTYILDLKLVNTSQELSTIVVSASKYAQKIQESISSIEVIKAKSIEIGNLSGADKAVDKMPGITIVNNEPQIRAGSGFSSGLGSRVMVMVDEIPLLRGDAGRPDWALLPIDDVEQIEVVKGASSVVFGSSAINGAINVRTAWPKDEPVTKIITFLGVYSKPERKYATPWTGMNPMVYGITLTHAQKFDNIDVTGGASFYKDEGYIGGTPEGKVADSIFNKGQYNNRVKLFFNSRVRSKKVEGLSYGINGNFMFQENAETYFWYDSDTNLYRSFPGSLSRFKTFTFYVDPFLKYYAKNGDIHSLKNRIYYLNTDGLYNQSSLCVTLFNEYQFTHKFKKAGDLMLVTGIMNIYSYSFGKVFSGKLAPDGTTTLGDNGNYTAENFALYAQLEKKFFKRLSVLLGGRYEYYNLADLTESKPVFRAGLNLQAARATFLRLSVGQGYRVPSIGERYITTTSGNFGFYPNPSLAPESSISYELGFRQLFKFGKFGGMFDIAGFYENYENYVEFNFGYWGLNPNPSKDVGFKFFNTGPARIYGIDASIAGEGDLTRNLKLSFILGYTYAIPQALDPNHVFYVNPNNANNSLTYLTTSSDTTDHILKYRVQGLLKADVQVTWKQFSTGFNGRYYSYMKNIDKFFYEILDGQMFGVKTGIKKYREDHKKGTFIVDYRISYALNSFKFSVIVNNLLDTEFSLRPLTIEPPRMTQVQVIYKI
ncbi:MAG: TonB-dependent receptor [Bacteroidales bacterium]|nr:TonB-dependent receptor [Bacteroidales bacterium]